MRRLRNVSLALFAGCLAPLLIWVGAGSALYHSRKQARLLEKALPNWACSIDADCPPGFVCAGGYCVLEKTR